MKPTSNIIIRPSTDDDIAGIASVLVDTWRSTFRGLLPDEFLDGMSKQHQIVRYPKKLSQSKVCCFVAADMHGHIRDFCYGGSNRSSALAIPAEIYALYAQKVNQRSGLGRKLFSATANQLASLIGPGISAWVLDINPSKIFYAHIGGNIVAIEETLLGAQQVTQAAYAW